VCGVWGCGCVVCLFVNIECRWCVCGHVCNFLLNISVSVRVCVSLSACE